LNKTGGILGIIGGVFGFIAAVFTLFFGGIGAAFNAEGASTIIGFGYGGIFFSFASIVCAAMVFAKPKGAGIALILCAIFGAVLGGTFVAICMSLSLIGGALAMIYANSHQLPTSIPMIESQTNTVLSEASASNNIPNKLMWIYFLGLLVFTLVLLSFILPKSTKTDSLTDLVAAIPSDIKPSGELEKIFMLGGQYTDLQREKKLDELKGQVVFWQLPIFDVKRHDDVYRVQTSSRIGSLVGAFIDISPRNNEERVIIENMKTGDLISFKGRIFDTTMRSFNIKPAILFTSAQHTSQTQVVSNAVDVKRVEESTADDEISKAKAVPKRKVSSITLQAFECNDTCQLMYVDANGSNQNAICIDLKECQSWAEIPKSFLPLIGAKADLVIGKKYIPHGGLVMDYVVELSLIGSNPSLMANALNSETSMQVTTEMPSISQFVGKHPTNLFHNKFIDTKLKALLKSNYAQFVENMSVSSEIQDAGDYIYGSGIAPHGGGSDEAGYAIHKKTGVVYAVMLVDGKDVKWFGAAAAKDFPNPLRKWLADMGVKI
jgi:hypothetical protein